MADRFTLLERVGQGSMGAVWKAVDNQTGDKVALKTIHSFYGEDAEYRARFEREVDIARRIQSPYIVKVFGYGQQDGLPYIAMEYVEGRSLRDLIRERGKLTWDQARTIFEQVAAGLDAAHRAGVIHRDLKPSNILLSDAGTAKLADFGISRLGDLTALTSSNAMLGTAAYMAPEDGSSVQSDIYSLGCLLYEMLAGNRRSLATPTSMSYVSTCATTLISPSSRTRHVNLSRPCCRRTRRSGQTRSSR